MRGLKSLITGSMLLASSTLYGQTTFEVASVKQSAPLPGSHGFVMKGGGIGNIDPGQFIATAAPLLNLILRAYGLVPSQVSSARPLDADRYDITAKVRRGATVAQVNVMLQNLLAERIGLVLHHETRLGPVYEMVVAKGGLKMKPAELAPGDAVAGGSLAEPDIRLPAGISTAKDGTFQLAPGYPNRILDMIDDYSTMRLTARMQGAPELISVMERLTGRTVLDRTGLTGKYDFELTYDRATAPTAASEPLPDGAANVSGSDFFTAIQSQLGLKLVPKKGPVDVLVVDRWNKAPTGN